MYYSARAAHEQVKESRPTSRIRAPAVHAAKGVDVLDDPRAAAAVRRDMAYRNLESVRREHAVEAERYRVLGVLRWCLTGHWSGEAELIVVAVLFLDKQRRELADELNERRRVELLLRIVEKRETVHLGRIGMGDDGGRKGLGTLVDLLRCVHWCCFDWRTPCKIRLQERFSSRYASMAFPAAREREAASKCKPPHAAVPPISRTN